MVYGSIADSMRLPFPTDCYYLVVRIVFVSLFFSAGCSYSCLAQMPLFRHLDVQDSPDLTTVLSITQDAKGFMWFCTPAGVSRYDSRSFKTYKADPTNPHSISSDYAALSLSDSRQNLWIGTAKGLNKYLPSTDSFQQVLHDSSDNGSLSSNSIYSLHEDSKRRLWVGTFDGLNCLVDPSTNRFKRYFFSKTHPRPGVPNQNTINAVCEDKKGNIWVATPKGLIRMTFDRQGIRYKTFRSNKRIANSLINNWITTLATDSQNNVWIGTISGDLDRYDPSTESFTHYRKAALAGSSTTNNEINRMHTDKTGMIWIGTVEGLIQLEPSTLKFTHYKNDPDNPHSLSDNNIYSIFRDRQGSVWVGTYYGGVNILYPNSTPFSVLDTKKSGLTSKQVNSITEDAKHNLWIGSDGAGLDYVNRQTGSVTHYGTGSDPTKNLPSKQIKDIYVDKDGYTWVATYRGGLSRLDPANHQWTSYHVSSDINADNVSAVLEDSQKRFWCLLYPQKRRIALFNKQKGTFQLYPSKINLPSKAGSSIEAIASSSLIEDSHRNIWFGGFGGVYRLRFKSVHLEWIPFKDNPQNNNTTQNGVVNSIHEDNRGRIWAGTQSNGLKRFDPIHNAFIDYTKEYGLPKETIKAIQSDKAGILWISAVSGLIRFDPETRVCQIYNKTDGVPGTELQAGSSYKDATDKLYFGSNDGLLYFDPALVKINKQAPPVVFTGLEVSNKLVNVGDESHLLAKDIGYNDQLIFDYQQNFFTISFAVLNHIKSEKNQYAYKLDGLDQEWHSIKTPSITYNNLPSGEYTLLVKGANNDGIWSPKPTQLRIVMLPPWWKTWWAYCLYLLSFGLILYLILRFFWLRNTFNREQELYQTKLDFFTNISHEIRTHLTLIVGPIDVLLRTKKSDKDIQKQLAYAKNSSDSLLNLVTELMDFRKAESKQLVLHISQNDIVTFIKNILISFEYLSEKRNANFSFSSSKETIQLWFDTDQLAKVVFNLLSNAYKFISDNGEIRISIDEKIDFVEIKVYDNGKGISEENVKKLFTNYFQVHDYGVKNTGYGIGLALSKTITELHKGTLSVESKEAQNDQNGFTCFTIRLRKGHHHFTKDQLIAPTPQPVVVPAFQEEAPVAFSEPVPEREKTYTILLVEDNAELRSFVKGILMNQYHIIEAVDGLAGWEAAIEHIPDMVISDIMMANLDGLELCSRLKSDERTSHIPVILLTAKATVTHQVEGLETGADSYITKPVNVKLLELTIRNLFSSRESIRQKYSQQVILEPQNIISNSVDKGFIHKVIQITEEHMSNPEFGVEMLTIEVGMSAPVLYKKMKALTNMSVNDFTKSIRMKKAAQLLQQRQLNINEVAYEVGFEDRRYFSREFKKVFGLKPSEYAKGYPMN